LEKTARGCSRTERLYRYLADEDNQAKVKTLLEELEGEEWQRVATLSIRGAVALLRGNDADDEEDDEEDEGDSEPPKETLTPSPSGISTKDMLAYNPETADIFDSLKRLKLPVILAKTEPEHLFNILTGPDIWTEDKLNRFCDMLLKHLNPELEAA
jgi:hypothetical protein